MSNAKRSVIVVSIVLVGLAVSLLLDPPLVWFLAALTVLVTCIGTDHIVHNHWRVHLRRKRYMATILILPSLVVAGSFLFLRLLVASRQASPWLAGAAGLVLTGLLLTAVIVGQYRTLDPGDALYRPARLGLNLIAYLTAFSLYSAIYSTKLRSIFSGTAILVITALICLDLFRESETNVGRTWLFSGVVAVAVGEITWALNYWTINALSAGMFLVLCLYLISGLVQNQLAGRLSWRVATEFASVTLVGFGLILGIGG